MLRPWWIELGGPVSQRASLPVALVGIDTQRAVLESLAIALHHRVADIVRQDPLLRAPVIEVAEPGLYRKVPIGQGAQGLLLVQQVLLQRLSTAEQKETAVAV